MPVRSKQVWSTYMMNYCGKETPKETKLECWVFLTG